ncbi:fimbrillin family protein [Sphingobacterium paucimobilis]|uniref:Fimbrillin family protein n=1 Tax=Sphingobacterium paucimobilis HER1398 TaxID=1346330 RepID=U2J3I7_9SPHI|nr:fimbrillin family protein [Sphingobacterium paucimobilis]ERJ57203.1 hypothetical protein M472_00340 [Sphingobacterium paucimobilis HER1398]
MKKKQLLGAALALIVLGNSCKNDDYRNVGPENDGKVSFTSSIGNGISTRVSGNNWDANDAIGVFMKQGAGLASPLATNKKYTTSGNGNFTGQGAEIINYPETGAVDFIAYYPYSATLSGTNLPIDVTTQTNPAAIDVLYANNATGLTKASPTANLSFSHKLAKIELTVKGGTGVPNVNGLQVVYNGINTTATMDLATGTVTGAANAKNVTAKATAGTGSQLVEAIVIPGSYAAKEVIFTLASGTFKWAIPANTSFEAGKKYTYDIQLSTGSTGNEVAVTGAGTITDWTTVPGGSFNVDGDGGTDPGPDPGTGTEQTLFLETFGTAPASKDFPKSRIAEFLDFSEKGVKYSDQDPANYVDIRATSTMDPHVWIPANRTTGFKIEGINTTGATKLKLSYDITANGGGASVKVIKVRANGQELTVPAGSIATSNTYVAVNIDAGIPTGNSLTLEFSTTNTENTVGYRIDNIKLVGTK